MASRIGLISDTHGLVRVEALEFLRGCDHIVHAGDIGGPGVLEQFAALAPVTAVRGNNDTAPWARRLPEVDSVQIEAVRIHVLHDLVHLALDPAAAGIAVVVSGHSHRPLLTRRGNVTFVNPGSAGPRRFRLPISLAELHIEGAHVTARLIELPDVRDATAKGA